MSPPKNQRIAREYLRAVHTLGSSASKAAVAKVHGALLDPPQRLRNSGNNTVLHARLTGYGWVREVGEGKRVRVALTVRTRCGLRCRASD